MAIILSFKIETIRGPVSLTSNLSGMKAYEVTNEIDCFFSAALSLQYKASNLEREQRERLEDMQKSYPSPAYQEPAEQEEIMVLS